MSASEDFQYPILIRVSPKVPWKIRLRVKAQDGNDNYRLFIRSRDGRWYKQKDPILTMWRGRSHVFCQFGDEQVDAGTSYKIVALTSIKQLPNSFPDALLGSLEQSDILQVSPVHEVSRV